MPDGSGVVSYLVGEGKDLLVSKLVPATTFDPLCIEGHGDPGLQSVLDQYGGVKEIEGATPEARSQIGLCTICKDRLACLKVDGTARAKVFSGL